MAKTIPAANMAREAGNTEVGVSNIAPWPTGRKV